MDADLLFRGAIVIDGTGADSIVTDVAVSGGRIVAVGDLAAMRAGREMDLTGKVLCPGFIDIHTHSDLSLLLGPEGESKVLQGVTTEVTGNCSISPFPVAPDRLVQHTDHLDWIGYDPVLKLSWTDLDGYAKQLAENPPALNIAPLVGHGAVRTAVMGHDQRPPTPDELAEMRVLVRESLDQGAFGMSTGLTVVPSAYADTNEVRELLRVVAGRGALYATHARSPVGEGFPEVAEAIATSLAVGARLQFSHAAINEPAKWGRADEVVAMFEDAERQGLDIGFDVYPYAASSSPLIQYIPGWVQAGGLDAMRTRLADPAERERAERELAAGWAGGIPWLWDRVVISRGGPGHEWCVGMSIEDAARQADVEPAAFTLDLCRGHGNNVQAVLHYRVEDDVRTFLAHRLSVIGSDGIALPLAQNGSQPHPRSFGAYPRVLGRYVREQRVLSLTEAVHKMTGAVADRLRLTDRGRLHPDAVADLVVFDPHTVIDHATFTDPGRAPTGITHVLVNGTFVVDDGKHTNARPGQVLRRKD